MNALLERLQCYQRHQKGHFSKCCSSTCIVVDDVSSEHSDLNSVFLDTLSLTNFRAISVTVEGEQVKFKVDTGAEVTAISERSYRD